MRGKTAEEWSDNHVFYFLVLREKTEAQANAKRQEFIDIIKEIQLNSTLAERERCLNYLQHSWSGYTLQHKIDKIKSGEEFPQGL